MEDNIDTNTDYAATLCKSWLDTRLSFESGKLISFAPEIIGKFGLTAVRNHEDEFLAEIELSVSEVLETKSAIYNVQALCKRARDAMGEACVLSQQGKEWESKAAEAVSLATLAKACYHITEEMEENFRFINQSLGSASYRQYFVLTSARPHFKRILWKLKYIHRQPAEMGFKVINQDLEPIALLLRDKFEKFDNDVLDWGSILTSNNILIAGLLGGIAYCLVQIVMMV